MEQTKLHPALVAAGSGDVAVFTDMPLEAMKDVRGKRDGDQRTALHVAAAGGHEEIVRLMVREDIPGTPELLNSADDAGWTPLMSATSTGHIRIVELLISAGADVNKANRGGRSALHYAASKGFVDVARVLTANGARVNRKDEVGCSPLHRAASTGQYDVCLLLLEEGADVDARDVRRETPLMMAVSTANTSVAILLSQHGASVDAEDVDGNTALSLASNELRRALVNAANEENEMDVDR